MQQSISLHDYKIDIDQTHPENVYGAKELLMPRQSRSVHVAELHDLKTQLLHLHEQVVKLPGPGLGDVVAGATKAVGIKPCGGCQKRQAAMNRATPSYVRRVLAWLRAAPVPRFRPSRRP